MNLSTFQNEVNHLLFLYFTTIGVIQRDATSENINAEMDALLAEIKRCRDALYSYLDNSSSGQEPYSGHEDSVVDEARAFIDDGLFLIDRITDSSYKFNK